MNENENEHVSLVRVPRRWYYAFIVVFSGSIISYTAAEILFDWAWKSLGETIFTRMSVLMTLIVGWCFIAAHTLEILLTLCYKIFNKVLLAKGAMEALTKIYLKIEQFDSGEITLEELRKVLKTVLEEYKTKS